MNFHGILTGSVGFIPKSSLFRWETPNLSEFCAEVDPTYKHRGVLRCPNKIGSMVSNWVITPKYTPFLSIGEINPLIGSPLILTSFTWHPSSIGPTWNKLLGIFQICWVGQPLPTHAWPLGHHHLFCRWYLFPSTILTILRGQVGSSKTNTHDFSWFLSSQSKVLHEKTCIYSILGKVGSNFTSTCLFRIGFPPAITPWSPCVWIYIAGPFPQREVCWSQHWTPSHWGNTPSSSMHLTCALSCKVVTLPETNSSHLKMDGWKTSFLLGRPIFRCYVSFREGKGLILPRNLIM